jgi:hypothetical protein
MLPEWEKVRLINNLKASMVEEPEVGQGRFAVLYKAATDIVGKGILSSSRLREKVVGRMMIVYQMRTEGYSLMEIGRHLVRHHASVYQLQRKMEDVLKYPKMFSDETRMWNEFQEKIKEYEVQD